MIRDSLKIADKTAVDAKVGRISQIKNMRSIIQLFLYKYNHKTFENINLDPPEKNLKWYIRSAQKKLFGQLTQDFN